MKLTVTVKDDVFREKKVT